MANSVPLTGRQYELAAGDYRATVTALGAGLRRLSYRGQDLIISYDADEVPPAGAGELLAPWPNRVDRGRYSFGGGDYQLDLSEPANGNAIHGLTRWAGWQAAVSDGAQVLLRHQLLGRPGYPFCLDLAAGYRLGPDGLTVTVTARNAGSRPAPYGTGHHPYLTAGAPLIDGCELTLPTAAYVPAGERGLPGGPPQDVAGSEFDFLAGREIGATVMDHALTGLRRDGDGRAWARLRSGGTEVALWAGDGYSWLQVFTGDPLPPAQRRSAIAIEPMTCPPNAFVTGDDLITLDPGASVTRSWGITASLG